MADPYVLARQYRRRLLYGQQAAAQSLIDAYKIAYAEIKRESDILLNRIAAVRASGKEVTRNWLVRQSSYQSLLTQIESEITKFSRLAESGITAMQSSAIDAALTDSTALMTASATDANLAATFATLPRAAFESAVGLGDGSPLVRLLGELPKQAQANVKAALLNGIAAGRSTDRIAREIQRSMGGTLTRSLTIARTETLRAYRSASLESYRANSDIVLGWQWQCATTPRTCAACWSLNGSIHPLDEDFSEHPNGRCTAVPIISMSRAKSRPTGEQLFAKQSAANQRLVLGEQGYELYRSGKVKLSDFVGTHSHPDFGTMHYQRSVKEIRGSQTKRRLAA